MKLGTIVLEGETLLILDAAGKCGASVAASVCRVVEPGTYGRNQLVRYDHAKVDHAQQLAKVAFLDPADRPAAGASEKEKAEFKTKSLAKRLEKLTDAQGKHTGWAVHDS